MRTRLIGSLEVSVVGLGCNNFGGRIDERQTQQVVDAALDAGISFFDTADVYGATRSEELLGRALGSRISEVVVATKFGHLVEGLGSGASRTHVRRACEASLRRLGTDRVDLYQLHVPDPAVSIGDTLDTLGELVEEGKVREIGCSNFSAAQLREAELAVGPAGARFVSLQNRYSVLHREPEVEVLDACAALGVAFLPFFPLESGLLSGKYRRGEEPPPGTRLAPSGPGGGRFAEFLDDEKLVRVEQLDSLASEHGRSVLELAIAWLIANEQVASVIAGATTPEQVRANAAADSFVLTPELLAAVEQIASGPGRAR